MTKCQRLLVKFRQDGDSAQGTAVHSDRQERWDVERHIGELLTHTDIEDPSTGHDRGPTGEETRELKNENRVLKHKNENLRPVTEAYSAKVRCGNPVTASSTLMLESKAVLWVAFDCEVEQYFRNTNRRLVVGLELLTKEKAAWR